MKRLLFILALIPAMAFSQTDLSKWHDDGTLLNELDDNITDLTTGEATNVTNIALKANIASPVFTGTATIPIISQTATVTEITTLITLDSTKIAGSTVGRVGHVDGAVLVTATSSDYALEFVSAILIYDYGTAAYTGGGNDVVVQEGASGSQVTVSSAVTGANLLEASGDKLLRLGAIATEVVPLVGGALSITGTSLINGGTAVGTLRVHLTYRVHTTGL